MGFPRRSALSLALVLVSACITPHAARPTPSVACTATEGQFLTLTGSVREEKSGRPAEAVLVGVTGTTFRTVTDRAGAYRIEGIPLGRYEVTASRVGYELARDTAVAAAPELRPACETEVIVDFLMTYAPLCVDC
jgi:hypothetical protein